MRGKVIRVRDTQPEDKMMIKQVKDLMVKMGKWLYMIKPSEANRIKVIASAQNGLARIKVELR